MNRRKATAFVIENGYDNLPQSLKTFLDTRSEHAYYCVDYPLANVLWINIDDLDIVLQNSAFWNCLVDGTIKSYKNFNIRTKSDIIDTPNDGLSNDGTMAIFMYNDSSMISEMTEYLSDDEYKMDFYIEPGNGGDLMGKLYNKINKIMNGIFDYCSMALFGKVFNDTVKHSVLLFLINTILFFVYYLFFNLTSSLTFATIVSMVIIFTREILDKRYTTGFSKKDIFYGQFGVFMSVLLIIIISNIF